MFPLLLSHLQALQDTDPSNSYLHLYLGGPEDDSIGVETCSPIPTTWICILEGLKMTQ